MITASMLQARLLDSGLRGHLHSLGLVSLSRIDSQWGQVRRVAGQSSSNTMVINQLLDLDMCGQVPCPAGK